MERRNCRGWGSFAMADAPGGREYYIDGIDGEEGRARLREVASRSRYPSSISRSVLDRGETELGFLDRRHRRRRELVVHEDRAPYVPRLPLRPLHLVADQARIRVVHTLAVLVDDVAEVPRLADVEELRG